TIGELKFILALLIYMAINGHHFLIKAVFQSFQIIPPGTASLNLATAEHFLRMVVNTFIIAIKIAGPAMITLFLTSVALGIIARTVPQMNVFIVGFPLKIGVGMLVLAAGLTYFSAVFTRMMTIAEKNIATLLIPTM
ncbi:MAG: flagellar type III secretion system protein FliR, partial [candidate division Zixibacteria bacterium]|nr:flagellar type III secretion system protein FliR [candidate division Zixibacteria bacterium]